MGKRSKSSVTVGDKLVVKTKGAKKHKKNVEDNVTSDESKCDESVTNIKDKKLIRKIKKITQPNTIIDNGKKNKKIIFNDDDGEPVEVENPPLKQKRSNEVELHQENEEDIKDEDIDKFCAEINEEDNEQYESWVKLIEAKLHSNKKKPK